VGPAPLLMLQAVMKDYPDKYEFIVKSEMAFFAHTHKADKIARPELFRLNGISHEEKLENLLILLERAILVHPLLLTYQLTLMCFVLCMVNQQ